MMHGWMGRWADGKDTPADVLPELPTRTLHPHARHEGHPHSTTILDMSYRDGFSHNTGRFARDVLLLFSLAQSVITFLECHTTRAGGRPKFVQTHRCYDCAQLLRLNPNTIIIDNPRLRHSGTSRCLGGTSTHPLPTTDRCPLGLSALQISSVLDVCSEARKHWIRTEAMLRNFARGLSSV